MRRFVRSENYARARLVSGGLFVVFGIAIEVRTLGVVGLSGAAVPAYVLGGAMIALGVLRFRDYIAARNRT
jgi:hypothetical protein